MEKFSLYEFMSFFLPGVFAAFIGLQLLPEKLLIFNAATEGITTIVFTIIAILLGLLVHCITFFALDRWPWYKRITTKSIEAIVKQKDDLLASTMHILNEKYNPKALAVGVLFDKAYFYLEYHNKNASAKAFQSIYFFLRNIFTTCVLYLPFLIFIALISGTAVLQTKAILLLILFVGALPCLIWMGHFYRSKMVGRIFNVYLLAMSNKSKDETEMPATED
jgi:hypothetical protein